MTMAVFPIKVEARGLIINTSAVTPPVYRPFRMASLPVIADKPKPVIRYRVSLKSRNCVTTVRRAGYYVPRSKDGYARTIPVTSKKLPPEGKLVVVKTADSYMGHVSVVINKGGRLITVIDSAFGPGRVIPPSVYRGYI